MSVNSKEEQSATVMVLLFATLLAIGSIPFAFGEKIDAPSKYNVQFAFNHEDCVVYSFIAERHALTAKKGYFARCGNGKTATTMPDGSVVLTEPPKE